jgi:dihydrofolate reductase
MGRVVVSEFLTLDGVMEDPGGQSEFAHGGWAFRFDRGEAGNRFKLDELMSADALLLGRRTYEGFVAAWPQMTDNEFGQKMTSMPKYVVSSMLSDPSWTSSTVIDGDIRPEVDRLTDQAGALLVAGSPQLVQSLLAARLVDELRLMVYPTVLGCGKRLFDSVGPINLWLVHSEAAAETLLLTYHRATGQ